MNLIGNFIRSFLIYGLLWSRTYGFPMISDHRSVLGSQKIFGRDFLALNSLHWKPDCLFGGQSLTNIGHLIGDPL